MCSSDFICTPLYFARRHAGRQRHADIFDLVSGIQQEALREEKLGKERRRVLKERMRAKERKKEKACAREAGVRSGERPSGDGEVLRSRGDGRF